MKRSIVCKDFYNGSNKWEKNVYRNKDSYKITICKKFVKKYLGKLPKKIRITVSDKEFQDSTKCYVKAAYDNYYSLDRVNYSLTNSKRPRGVLYWTVAQQMVDIFKLYDTSVKTIYFSIKETK